MRTTEHLCMGLKSELCLRRFHFRRKGGRFLASVVLRRTFSPWVNAGSHFLQFTSGAAPFIGNHRMELWLAGCRPGWMRKAVS